MDKGSKLSLKSSKRKQKDLCKKVKSLTKQGMLEEGLDYFNSKDESFNKENQSSVDNNKEQLNLEMETEGVCEISNDITISENSLINKEAMSAVILNLPHDSTTEELSNFLSKRGIPVDALSIDNGKYAVIESTDPDAFMKIKSLIAKKPLLNSENVIASKLFGNTQRLEEFCRKNTIFNKSIVIVKNINCQTNIDEILSLIPEENEIKKHTAAEVQGRKCKSQMLTIEFVSQSDTDNVIQQLNGKTIDGNKLVVAFKHKLVEDSVLETQSLNLLIKDLPDTTDYETIKNFELPCSKMELHKKNAKRSCFLTFKSIKDASEAYLMLSNKEIDGKKIKVKFVNFHTEKSDEGLDKTKLHITNLPYSCTKEDMEKEFDMAESLKFPLNASGKSKGCCYLTFGSDELAALAMEGFKDKVISGRKIKCNYAKKSQFTPSSEETTTKKRKTPKKKMEGNVVTLFNLPKTVKIDDIKSKFEHVKLVNIVKKGEVFKGIAEVHFTNSNSAKAAIDLPEFSISGRVIRKELKGGKWRDGVEKKSKPFKPFQGKKKTETSEKMDE